LGEGYVTIKKYFEVNDLKEKKGIGLKALIIIVIVILALEFLLGLTTDSKVETLDREKVKKEKKNKV